MNENPGGIDAELGGSWKTFLIYYIIGGLHRIGILKNGEKYFWPSVYTPLGFLGGSGVKIFFSREKCPNILSWGPWSFYSSTGHLDSCVLGYYWTPDIRIFHTPILRVPLDKKIATQAIERLVMSCGLQICVVGHYLGGGLRRPRPRILWDLLEIWGSPSQFQWFFRFFTKIFEFQPDQHTASWSPVPLQLIYSSIEEKKSLLRPPVVGMFWGVFGCRGGSSKQSYII